MQFSTTVMTYTVTFENEFVDVPSIQLTVRSGDLNTHARAFIYEATTTGFSFVTYKSEASSANGFVHWAALS